MLRRWIAVAGVLALAMSTPADAAVHCGLVSWYGRESGDKTANGEHFDGTSLTAAHKTLPFNSVFRFHRGGKSIVVRINDRGPFVPGREFDLSAKAAEAIDLDQVGVGTVCWERLK